MNKERRKFTKEFKEGAVRLLEESGREPGDIARELEVAVEYLYRWRTSVQKARARGQKAFPGQGRPHDEEIAALKKENERLRQEREILKKALGLFTPAPK
jgi:transposase